MVIVTPNLTDAIQAELELIRRRLPDPVVTAASSSVSPITGWPGSTFGRDRDVASDLASRASTVTFSVLGMELCLVSLLLGWLWVVVTGSNWPAPRSPWRPP